MIEYTVTRGETLTVALEATSGDVAGASVVAALKRAVDGRQPGDAAPVLASFTPVAAEHVDPLDAASGPGWQLTLNPTQTAALATGLHIADARVTVAGGAVETTEPVLVRVLERVTPS